jgi:predicted DNA-binding transcriptional regulator AlpA
MNKRFARLSDLASSKGKKGIIPVSAATWWRWCAEGRAPKPFKLGPNTTVWDLDQVEEFLAQRAGVQQA